MSFDVKLCAAYVETLIRHDEWERALLVLDNVPAHFRLQTPPELAQLRSDILKCSVTAHTYTKSTADENMDTEEHALDFLQKNIRGRLIEQYVTHLNQNDNVVPHLIDFGPGPYAMPRALKKLGLKFTYWDLGLNQRAQAKYRELISDHLNADGGKERTTIFLALEVIEHLHNPIDLATEASKQTGGRGPEIIMLSTPFCTYRVIPDEEDWRRWNLEHLRAYTPEEFETKAKQLFPGYEWEMTIVDPPHLQPMSLVGTKLGLFKKEEKPAIV